MRQFLLLGLALAWAGAPAVFAAEPVTPKPAINALFKVYKRDGSTLLAQAAVAAGGSTFGTVKLRQVDAIAAGNGRCAFNVKLDEVANVDRPGTVDRLYANDRLAAQMSGIELKAGVLRTVWTQPYLDSGVNNVRVVLDADGPSPSVGWVRVLVDGRCDALAAPEPPPAPKPPPVVPGSADWNRLYNAWGYSNYARRQLDGRGYGRYADVVALNRDLSAVVQARRVEAAAYAELMRRWAALADDAGFKAAMAAIVPPAPGRV